jgi:hypothetical protein
MEWLWQRLDANQVRSSGGCAFALRAAGAPAAACRQQHELRLPVDLRRKYARSAKVF